MLTRDLFAVLVLNGFMSFVPKYTITVLTVHVAGHGFASYAGAVSKYSVAKDPAASDTFD